MMNHFAHRLKLAMDAKGITQAELCAETGIGKSAISQYLSGKHTARREKINSLARALEVNPAWLMGFDMQERQFCLRDLFTFNDMFLQHWASSLIVAYANQIPQIQKAVCDVLGIQFVNPTQSFEDCAKFEEVLTSYLSHDPVD